MLTTFGFSALQGPHQLAQKSTNTYLLGGSGGIEAVASVLAVNRDCAPPTINLQNPDPACDLDYIPNVARNMPINVVLSNSFGFGGHNVSLVFKKYLD
ncbi:MAG: hypothetical protein ACKVOM_05860 [Ferruginibacter sp.]